MLGSSGHATVRTRQREGGRKNGEIESCKFSIME